MASPPPLAGRYLIVGVIIFNNIIMMTSPRRRMSARPIYIISIDSLRSPYPLVYYIIILLCFPWLAMILIIIIIIIRDPITTIIVGVIENTISYELQIGTQMLAISVTFIMQVLQRHICKYINTYRQKYSEIVIVEKHDCVDHFSPDSNDHNNIHVNQYNNNYVYVKFNLNDFVLNICMQLPFKFLSFNYPFNVYRIC